MTSEKDPVPQLPPPARPSWLRRFFYLFMILFFISVSAVAIVIAAGLSRTSDAIVEPVGEFFRNLAVPATPVILPDSVVVVGQINNLARLETVSYELKEIVTSQRVQEIFGFEIELESMVFVGYGTVVAGVDFSKMQTADLQVVDPNTVMVHLPEAEIFADLPVLNTELSYVADRDTLLLVQADPQLETQMRQAAEQAIIEAAQSTDILKQANTNAQEYMLNFLNGLGFDTVIFMSETPPTAVPYEQELPKGFILVTPTPGTP